MKQCKVSINPRLISCRLRGKANPFAHRKGGLAQAQHNHHIIPTEDKNIALLSSGTSARNFPHFTGQVQRSTIC